MSLLFLRFAVMSILYDLKANFNNAIDQTFSNTDILSTDSKGIQSGSLTVVDTSTGTVKVVSNKLELVGNGASYLTTGVVGNAITKALGKAMFWTHNASANLNSYMGMDEDSTLQNSPYFFLWRANAELRVTGSSATKVGTLASATDYKLLILLGGFDSNKILFITGDTVGDFLYGAHFFIKGGTYTAWTRVWMHNLDNAGTLYPQFNIHTAGQQSTLDNIKIPTNVLDPATMFNPAYHDVTPDNTVVDIGISDFLLDTNVTFPAGAETFQIRFRYQDADNFWNVKALSGTAGTDLSLHKTTTVGGEGATVATADCDFTAATHDIRIIVEGSTFFRVYVDGALKLTYTGPDTDFQTETKVQLVDAGSAFTENRLTAHYRTRSTVWGPAISAATGGTY